MGDMGILVTVLWQVIGRLLRRLGRGILLVPVAAMAPVLFGLRPWTVAAVLLAVVVALWRPVMAAAVLPVTMVVAGISGLVVAATVPGPTVNWVVSALGALKTHPLQWSIARRARFPRTMRPVATPGHNIAQAAIKPSAAAQSVKVPVPPQSYVPPAAFVRGVQFPAARLSGKGPIHVQMKGGPGGAVIWMHRGPVIHSGGGAWPSGLLVPLALLLLTLGLWLLPRSAAALRAHTAGLVAYLRHRMLENRWGVLLVPVALLGLTVFGVHPWTFALVLASVVTVARWPVIAADLVPVALASFAVRGFMIAASWQPLPPALIRPGLLYGAILVDSRQMAMLAGAEASAFLVIAAWLVPRTIGAHTRTMLIPGGTSSWRAGCSGSPRRGTWPWTTPPPNCAGLSGICTTGPRPA